MFKFRDMTIGKKVGFGFGVINLILMGVVLLIIQRIFCRVPNCSALSFSKFGKLKILGI